VSLKILADMPKTLDPTVLPAVEVEALYVHVPFCFHKCHYCDFYSITRQSEDRMAKFVDLTLAEADLWQRLGTGLTLRPRTIFFGGGTPTLLPVDEMRRLLAGLRQRIDFSRVDEFTVECNPATASLEYCEMLRAGGVGRISFGAQSFNPDELKRLERHHDPEDVPKSLEIARRAGFERINFDLIYAIPGQTLESWADSLGRAIALGTTHLSCYGLTYEENTPIAVRKRLGQLIAAEESLELDMLRHTRRRLTEAGLPPYEISNYAAPGEACRHNLVYWTGGSYIGLGPSAASHVHGWRWRNRPHLGEWERSASAAELPAIEVEQLSPHRRAGELAMLELRLARGVDFDGFAARTGFDARRRFADPLDRFARVGLLDIDDAGFRLTERGIVVADALAAEFLDVGE
jgi:oxygen-independent coproporphyrinogen-3 oxidase